MNRTDFKHITELPVLWGHMDALGHVNNVQYFRYLEAGRIAYCTQIMPAHLQAAAALVLADIQCSFLRQLHYPCTIEVGTRISRLGNRSMTVDCGIYIKDDDAPAATSKGIMVWFDFTNEKSAALPIELRETIQAYEIITPEN